MSTRTGLVFAGLLSAPLLGLLAACGERAAEPDLAAVDAATGAYKPCAACHGVSGEGNTALNAPALVNLDEWYLKRQLRNFGAGIRGTHADDLHGQAMAAQSAALTDAGQVEAIAAQIGSFPDIAPARTLNGDAGNGRDHYNMTCGACHGASGIGNEILDAPSLRGLDDWYLVRQYENFRSGVRGTHPDDRFGQQMQRMGHVLETADDVRDVAAYLAALPVDD